jgi:uncharacterized membrane protein YdjX (TVP38/TMEM64 family)
VAVKLPDKVHWLKLAIVFVVFVIISFGLAYLFQRLLERFDLRMYDFGWIAYLIVFAATMLANLTIIAPVPFATSIMLAAAAHWNPVLVALAAAAGGTLGELSGYYAGRLGKKIAIPESIIGYKRVEGWVQRYGIWAIIFLAFQPIIPFDLGGVIAGTTRMPLRKFLPGLFLGKFPKYIILIYAGVDLISWI